MAAVFVLAALAGCLDGDSRIEPEGGGPADDLSDASTFSQRFSLLMRPVTTVGGVSTNCVFLHDVGGPRFHVLNGTATLNWAAMPTTDSLRLVTQGADPNLSAGPSGSPVVMELGALQFALTGGRNTIIIWADHGLDDGSLPIEQSADITLDFTYAGSLPDMELGTCGDGLA